MDVRAIDAGMSAGSNNLYTPGTEEKAAAPVPPTADSVQAFNQGMNNSADNNAGLSSDMSKSADSGAKDSASQLDELLQQLISLIQAMIAQLGKSEGEPSQGQPQGGSTAGPGQGIKPVEGSGPGGSAGNGAAGGSGNSSELIPPPSEHVQQINLGGKPVTVGGDGSASAAEVEATSQSIQNLYQNSPTFKNMIDSSSDPSFEVSVGRRDDNTSWGNTEGRVFMNINNIAPGNSDSFQSLLGHEFAHASIDLGHGSKMENTEQAIAQEA